MPAKANPARKVGGGSKTKWKPKPGAPRATKKPRPVDERVKRHFVSLTAQIDGAHFKNAIKTCNKLLLLKPNDADVLQTKLFLLLQTEQYAPALELASATTGIDLDYQRAYSMYRLNQEAEAASLIANIKQRDLGEDVLRGVDILDAQLYYRRGDYEHAVQSFTQLLDSCAPGSEEQQDLLTNLTAAQTHLDFLTTGFQSALSKLPAATLQSLETAQPPAHPTASTSHVVPVAATAAAAATPAPKAPKPPRPSRVPKGVVPGVTPPPDPERWIKKSERTNLPVSRHKKGKKVVGAAGTTQGSTNIPESGHPTSSGGGGGGGKKKRR